MRTMLPLVIALCAVVTFGAAGDQGPAQKRSAKKQGWLGVSIQDVTPRFAREEQLKIKEGAYVNSVEEESPADSAGIREGDVITAFNTVTVESASDLIDAVRAAEPGSKAKVTLNRSGDTRAVTVTVGRNRQRTPFPVHAPAAPNIMVRMFHGPTQGMELMELKGQLAEYFDVPGKKGVLVQSVEPEEPAAAAGIKAGDVLVKIGEEQIRDMDDVRDAFEEIGEGATLPVELIRKGKKMTVQLKAEAADDEDGARIWRYHMPGHFNFNVEPRLERLREDLELRMKDLPKRKKELIRIEERSGGKEI